MSNYLEFNIKVIPAEPWTDVIISQLGEIGFESFMETDKGVLAYIPSDDYVEGRIEKIEVVKAKSAEITYSKKEIEQINWNAKWENSFNPIVVEDSCCVRAPFHQPCNVVYEIVIEPKMSFGTGHHETTFMMIQHLLRTNFNDKKVLDMGCGTAVLAILAEMKGAKSVDAIDIDNWCYLNSLENVERNECRNINVIEGDVELIKNKKYDIIIANINRNVLLNDIKQYAASLNKFGVLILSGFYKDDINVIEDECTKHLLKLEETLEKNNWVSLKFIH